MNAFCLMTGGTGFVGTWMSRTAPAGMVVYVMGRREYESGILKNITDFDYVIHLAPVHPARAVACAKRNNARLLYCSSGIVYHYENDIQYRKDKLEGERYCLNSGVDVVIARPFTFFGEKIDEGKAYPQFVKAAKENRTIEVQGDGNTVRSYMHGSELGRMMWAILLHGVSGEAYEVGDDKPITMLQLAQTISDIYKSTAGIIVKGGASPMPVYLPANVRKTRELMRG